MYCTQWDRFWPDTNSALSPAACQMARRGHHCTPKGCAVPRLKDLKGCAQLAKLVFWPSACSTYQMCHLVHASFGAEAYESKRFSLTANRCLKEEAF